MTLPVIFLEKSGNAAIDFAIVKDATLDFY